MGAIQSGAGFQQSLKGKATLLELWKLAWAYLRLPERLLFEVSANQISVRIFF